MASCEDRSSTSTFFRRRYSDTSSGGTGAACRTIVVDRTEAEPETVAVEQLSMEKTKPSAGARLQDYVAEIDRQFRPYRPILCTTSLRWPFAPLARRSPRIWRRVTYG